jgi:hypothetical protein
MCTDFTDLNKCCPKDNFPLSRIDKVVDSAAECETMAQLDSFSGYHHICLHKEDEEKCALSHPSTRIGIYECLKKVGPTFYRMTKAILKDQNCINIFTYVDDIVVVSKKNNTQMKDLAETFANMRGPQLKLNPEKCIFGVVSVFCTGKIQCGQDHAFLF